MSTPTFSRPVESKRNAVGPVEGNVRNTDYSAVP
jgi:hypothetical protein